jgi:tyrosinase
MSYSQLSRRTVLKGGASLSALAALATAGGCEAWQEEVANRPVRKSVTSAAAATDIATYDAAVAAMQALPPTDPRNWDNQAQIHNDFCPHGNWYFLPWHRAYLFYFENICRELTGVTDFALPYWNWQVDRAIPDAFWTGNLDHASRSAGPSSLASELSVGQSVIEGILALTNFEQFASYASTALRPGGLPSYGELEGGPHNYIHGSFVGGTMGNYFAPLDPVFWCHHNFIDCLWAHWNIHRGNPNIADADWGLFNLAGMFVDGDGSPVEVTCAATTLWPYWDYDFEPSPMGDSVPVALRTRRREVAEMFERGGNIRHRVLAEVPVATSFALETGESITRRFRLPEQILDSLAATGESAVRVLIRVSEVTPPARDDSFVLIFVSKPDATRQTSADDPHFAGSFAFFTDPEAQGPGHALHLLNYYVDITDTLARLRAGGMLSPGDPVTLSLLATPFETGEREPGRIVIGRLDVITTPMAVSGQ